MSYLDIVRSLASSAAQNGRGIATRPRDKQPEEPLELYDIEACPYCRLVRETLTEQDLDVLIFPCPKGGNRYRPLVENLGGQTRFPFLMDPNTGAALYESEDIIDYLHREYGDRLPPGRGLASRLRLVSSFTASVPRGRRGLRARPAGLAERPLELYSFEASPFARLVRERLCEMQLPYLIRQCGRDQWMDWVLPAVRDRLNLNYRPSQRNRRRLITITDMVAIPYLVDPNTGEERYESASILEYLDYAYQEPDTAPRAV
ncbi:glutathione S-transferase N-terminal domain-containing protein [Alloalcanivorax xenomutans]|uniref:glutathione S-transferase N-terminal domain-containing protein n=1 Tax=Alloalcanivorax xenomutans TaxID=1094342 RepID=UPI003C60A7DC